MSTQIRTHLRRNVVGYVACFLALSGGAYAAGLEQNSVRSKHIKNGQVKRPDLAAGAVSATKVADNALTGAQIDEASLDSAVLQRRIGAGCPLGQSIRQVNADGSVACEADDAGGGGTVTRVDTGTGLAGGPITTTGTASIATPYRLPQGCTNGQVAKSNGQGLWGCAADATGSGGPTGPAGGDLAGTYPNPQIAANAVGGSEVADNSLTGNDINEATLNVPGTEAYYVIDGPGRQFGIVPGETRQVEAVSVPAGNYTLAAHLGVGGGLGNTLACWFTLGGDQRITSSATTLGEGSEHVALIGAVSPTAPATVRVVCQSQSDNVGHIFFGDWTLVATKVAALHRQGP
ncbi:MAG: hypothetical protein M3355_00645 [Actinomycetota bacterium]|nr:hypothetical protein [Actinomycetota bacterium]